MTDPLGLNPFFPGYQIIRIFFLYLLIVTDCINIIVLRKVKKKNKIFIGSYGQILLYF